jgi:hypothetical protein
MTDTDAILSWSNGGGTDFIFYLRRAGSSQWDSVSFTGTNLALDTLSGCVDYEFMVRGVCPPSDTSGYSNVFSFSTDGCCTAPENVSVSGMTNNSASVNFDAVLAASSYNVSYKPISGSTWITVNSSTIPVTISSLDSCTVYEVQVETVCGTDSTGYTSSIQFATTGCGLCESTSYCAASGTSSASEWIQSVSVNTINNVSGNNGGYLFTGFNTDLYTEQLYTYSFNPGYSNSSTDVHFVVWIDYDSDRLFEASEIIHNSGPVNAGTNGNFTVPANAVEGSTRMRVAMKYVGGGSTSQPAACGSFAQGEVEDYCINIIDTTSNVSVNENEAVVIYQIYPNPANENITFDIINFKKFGGLCEMKITNSLGETVHHQKLTQGMTTLSTEYFANGIYYYTIDLNGTKRNWKFVVQK